MASKAFSVYTSFKAKDGVSGIFQNMKNLIVILMKIKMNYLKIIMENIF